MSPNRGRFIEFQSIEPKAVKAADRTIFMATGVGRMKIDVPNGKSNTSIMLKDVLYFPEGYTLVLLAKCDTTGFIIVLKEVLGVHYLYTERICRHGIKTQKHL